MSACEIADLLGAFSGKVNAHIQREALDGNGSDENNLLRTRIYDLYSIEMVTMLSFHISTPQAKTLRKWIIGRLSEKKVSSSSMIICYTIGRKHN